MNEQIEAILYLLQDPTSNLVATALGLALIVQLVLIIVLSLLAWIMPDEGRRKRPSAKGTGRGRNAEAQLPPARMSPVALGIAGVLLAGSVGAAYFTTGTTTYCADTCHQMSAVADTHEKSPHGNVACARCHEGRPALTLVSGVIQRTRSVQYAILGESPEGATTIPSANCLQCHSAVLEQTIQGSHAILMSHKEVIEAGGSCIDCHGAQGHIDEPLIVGMTACLRCHNGEDVSAECTMCHPKGADFTIRFSSQSVGSPVRLPEKPTCGGCHSEESCDECHGLRMPHPVDYADPYLHARPAAFEGKERVCYRCHVEADCGSCHRAFPGHAGDWRASHMTASRTDNRCRSCHRNFEGNMCDLCH